MPITIANKQAQEMLLVFHFFEKLAKTSCFAMPFCSFPSPQKRVKDLFRHEFHRFGAFLCQTNGHCKTNGHAISTCARYFCNSAANFSADLEQTLVKTFISRNLLIGLDVTKIRCRMMKVGSTFP